jgi:hypothetical protein
MDARHIPMQAMPVVKMVCYGPIEFGTGQYKKLNGTLWLFVGEQGHCWRVFDIPADQLRDPSNVSSVALICEPIDRPPTRIDTVAYMASPKLEKGMTLFFSGFFAAPKEFPDDLMLFRDEHAELQGASLVPLMPSWMKTQ